MTSVKCLRPWCHRLTHMWRQHHLTWSLLKEVRYVERIIILPVPKRVLILRSLVKLSPLSFIILQNGCLEQFWQLTTISHWNLMTLYWLRMVKWNCGARNSYSSILGWKSTFMDVSRFQLQSHVGPISPLEVR